jgi:hypothetical protein
MEERARSLEPSRLNWRQALLHEFRRSSTCLTSMHPKHWHSQCIQELASKTWQPQLLRVGGWVGALLGSSHWAAVDTTRA